MEDLHGLSRRSLMQRAILLVGATVAVGACDMLPGAGNDKDFALDASQFALLSAVAGTIVPKTDTSGAIEAGVPKTFEGLLRDWASAVTREGMLGALGRIDEAAKKDGGMGFAELDGTARAKLLAAHDAAALAEDPEGEAIPTAISFVPGGGTKLHDMNYSRMKELLVTLYYYSEPGLTEELHYEHNPGAWEPSIPVTEETRPWGGLGLM